ncbi:hypothetical protein AUEXF2481DRAFT_641394 [Aureobasidium subglaciale EXF-2481]|uniref:Uncharacterized protein n=1 Tax=Aureobasidium subglaciale (strain EXF-2481) TaxID=1043005 RepID=A0A074YKA6_AURSE|nr:uncharacterized protein AUEXF2481DRAFT_641394 [Aureobasidium subglaciale EXF-2481]KEQ96504.1 hypothetical protein AUEXF2481DRAFT_641394 [Aureobasidium subglaciale EXF-2481]
MASARTCYTPYSFLAHVLCSTASSSALLTNVIRSCALHEILSTLSPSVQSAPNLGKLLLLPVTQGPRRSCSVYSLFLSCLHRYVSTLADQGSSPLTSTRIIDLLTLRLRFCCADLSRKPDLALRSRSLRMGIRSRRQ